MPGTVAVAERAPELLINEHSDGAPQETTGVPTDDDLEYIPPVEPDEIDELIEAALTEEVALGAVLGIYADEDEAIRAHMKKVRTVAGLYVRRGMGYEDLKQEGSIGLLEAMRRFDSERGCKFSTFAYTLIHRAIKQGIYNQSRTVRLPADIHKLVGKLASAVRELAVDGQRPDDAELAKVLEITPERIKELRDIWGTVLPVSLDQPLISGAFTPDGEADTLADTLRAVDEYPEEPDPLEIKTQTAKRLAIEAVLSQMTEKRAETLRMLFGLPPYDIEYNVAEIAKMRNATVDSVHTLKRRAMESFRSAWAQQIPRPRVPGLG